MISDVKVNGRYLVNNLSDAINSNGAKLSSELTEIYIIEISPNGEFVKTNFKGYTWVSINTLRSCIVDTLVELQK